MDTLVQTVILGIMLAGLYACIASGVSIVVGVTRIINFAHGEMVMLGAYMTYYLYTAGTNIFLCMIASFVSMGILSLVSYRLFMRKVLDSAEHNQVLATYGLSILLSNAAMLMFSPIIKAMYVTMMPKVKLGSIVIPGNYIFVGIFGFVLYIGLILFVNKTKLGAMMKLTSENRQLAKYSGVNTNLAYEVSFVVGGALAGAAGTLVAVMLYVYPTVGAEYITKAFAIVVMGGLGSIPGALLGAVILAIAENLVSTYVSNGASLSFGVSFVLLVFMLVIRPNGFFGKRGDRA